jgi:GR25 family glycosyltransferase involved in LPS biosynthesis
MQFNITKIIEENKNLVDTKYIYNKTFKRFEEKNGENWLTNQVALKKVISEPTGFAILNGETDIYSSIISFSIDGSRILSITPTNEHFIFYVNGKEFIKTDVSQVQIPDIQGLHYVYFNENGVLESKTDFVLQEIMKKYASVATIYWDYINKKVIYIGDKRHSINSDAYQNYINFTNDKTVDYIEGTNIKFTNNIDGSVNDKVDGDGSSNYHTSFAIESGKYKNYDLTNNCEHIEFNENIPIFYKQTISQEKNWIAMASKTDGSVMVAIADDGEYRIMTSTDEGETWDKIYLPFYSTWTDIIYAQNKFIAIASSGTYSIISSIDGITWTPIIVPQKNKWQSITFGDGLFVVVSIDGANRIMTSTNGTLWIIRETPNYLPLKKVKFIPAYGEENSKFIAISEDDIFLLSNTQEDIKAFSKAFVSEDGVTWTNLNISNEKNWSSITYGNGRFVAFADTGRNRLLNTSNANIWATYELVDSTLDSQNWKSNIYAFGNHMAVSNTGTNRFIRSSNNGITWESLNSIGSNNWKKLSSNQSYIIALADNSTSRLKYSADNGTTWTSVTTHDTKTLEDIVFGDKWVLICSNATSGRIIYSSDLSTWTSVTTRDNVSWKSIAFSSGTYVAVGIDDNAWKLATPADVNDWRSVTYISSLSLFVAVSSTGTTVSRVMTSTDGTSWTIRSASEANSWQSITSDGTTLVAVSSDGTNRVMTSTNATLWTARSATQQNSWRSVTFGGGKFVAVSSDGTNRVMYSTNGTSWTASNTVQANEWYGVAYGNNLYVAVAITGTNQVMYSSDAITWTNGNAISNNGWTSVAYGGVFVAVSQNSEIMVSSNGIDWSQSGGSLNLGSPIWTHVTYANGQFIIIGPGNKLLVGSDGINWEVRDAASLSGWNSVAYGTNTYVAVGFDISSGASNDRVMTDFVDNNKIIWSADGITWTTSTIAVNKNWTKIKYLNNGFFALNTSNEIYFSVDGKTDWTKVTITIAEDQDLQYTDFATSGLILVFSTTKNKIVVTGIDVGSQNFNANARVLNIIDNLSLNDIEVNDQGQIIVTARQNKIITSEDNGETWIIKNPTININKIKFINNNFFLLSNTSYNRVAYSDDVFQNTTYITENNFNYSLVDMQYINDNYYFLINSGDKRIIKSPVFIEASEEDLVDYLEFKTSIKDIYNAWLRYDNLSINETIKNRCLINNNKINFNKFVNNGYSLDICNDNKFYLYHIFMTNDKDDKYFIIVGNYEYSSKEEAKNNILEEINKLNGLPFNDFLSLGTIIFEANSQYGNSAKARIVNINGNNYYKLIKKDLVAVSVNNYISQANKKDNSSQLLNNTDLINLYGNKILEYALNKLQNLTSRDIDNFIVRKEITLTSNSTINLSTIFGAQITGSYEIFDRNDPELSMLMFLTQKATSIDPNQEPEVNITSFSNFIIPTSNNSTQTEARLGVYIDNYIVNFKNFKASSINLVIYRKI